MRDEAWYAFVASVTVLLIISGVVGCRMNGIDSNVNELREAVCEGTQDTPEQYRECIEGFE